MHTNEVKAKDSDGNDVPFSDYDFCYVGAHDANGKEVYRKDLQGDELQNYLKTDWIDYRFIFTCDSSIIPKTYTVWPHSKTAGWLNKIDKLVEG